MMVRSEKQISGQHFEGREFLFVSIPIMPLFGGDIPEYRIVLK